jgi:sugar lactone lactonase YvrE
MDRIPTTTEELTMTDQAAPGSSAPPARRTSWPMFAGILVAFGLASLLVVLVSAPNQAADENNETKSAEKAGQAEKAAPEGDVKQAGKKEEAAPERPKIPAPDLDGGVAWINSGGPVSMKDLKGKVVLLDFWTLCCINCIHCLPDLHKLEKKYANELVVIGVHSPKFDNEKETRSIKSAVLRYEIAHPVVNDAERRIWDRYQVDAWPTMVLIDPEGNLVGYTSGEGNYELLDVVIGKLVKEHKEKKTLNEKPIRFDLAKYRETGDTPLFFPGKVIADAAGERLFIADSTHHRVVVTDLEGNHLATAGTGQPGYEDGSFDKARFDDPQGLAVKGDILYVADRKNHAIRALDLKKKTVATVAGNGQQADPLDRRTEKPVPARSIGLNSPWDLLLVGKSLYVAMAGHHQIWTLDLEKDLVEPFAGSGRENIGDGPLKFSMFAQPSGLASDGKFLYVADSEISAIRKLPLDGKGEVDTLVGRGLFTFGDRDGPGRVEDVLTRDVREARLQHALGVVHVDVTLYVADTYNSKIKAFDLEKGTLSTFLGGMEPSGWFDGPLFNEPAGISHAKGTLYVADTNAHRIRVVDLKTKEVHTLKLKGVEPPRPPKETAGKE